MRRAPTPSIRADRGGRRRQCVGFVAFFAGGIAGCFTADSLKGLPCRSDDDCSAVLDVSGQRISCQDGYCGVMCGDAVVIEEFEECDDGNDVQTDGCNACRLAICGDNVTWTGVEECDDGNQASDDSCVDCRIAFCGDGRVWQGMEACDDGNVDDTDDCAACKLVRCGDGVVDPATEACDDGDDDDDDGCNALCRMGAELLSTGDSFSNHVCAVREGGVRCWGQNDRGQLGIGTLTLVGDERSDMPPRDVDLGDGAQVTQVALTMYRTCVLLANEADNVRCWGEGLGLGIPSLYQSANQNLGDEPEDFPFPPVRVGGTASQIVVGTSHTCVLLDGADGDVRCWGDGDLGTGSTDAIGDDEEPGAVDPIQLGGAAVELAAGIMHTCARLVNGDVRCWGGSIGDDETPAAVPPVPLGRPALKITAGWTETCAMLEDGEWRCWTDASDIQNLEFDGELLQVLPGSRPCAVARGGNLFCWFPQWWQGGTDDHDHLSWDTRWIDMGGPAVQVTGGWYHTCVLLHGGGVRCWGSNDSGQLGLGHVETIGDEPGEMPPPFALLYGEM